MAKFSEGSLKKLRTAGEGLRTLFALVLRCLNSTGLHTLHIEEEQVMTISESIFNNYALKELKGKDENNPEILQFFKEIGHKWVKTDETAWCAATINAILKRTGFPYNKKLSAKSFLSLGEQISVPRPLGSSDEFVDIVLLCRPNKWINLDSDDFEPGHVGFFIKERGGLIYILSGNQSDQIKISAYKRERLEQYRRIFKAVS